MQLKYLHVVLYLMLIAGSFTASAQNYSLPNEVVIFSFDTQNGKRVSLNKDRENKYLIYRFGTKSHIEFQFPDTTAGSWKKFTYSFFLRGGGAQNEGIDLNYIYFTNKNFTYIIYDTYSAADEKVETGIKIIDTKTNKTTIIKGNSKTRKGTLIDFRDNGLLTIGDELFN